MTEVGGGPNTSIRTGRVFVVNTISSAKGADVHMQGRNLQGSGPKQISMTCFFYARQLMSVTVPTETGIENFYSPLLNRQCWKTNNFDDFFVGFFFYLPILVILKTKSKYASGEPTVSDKQTKNIFENFFSTPERYSRGCR